MDEKLSFHYHAPSFISRMVVMRSDVGKWDIVMVQCP